MRSEFEVFRGSGGPISSRFEAFRGSGGPIRSEFQVFRGEVGPSKGNLTFLEEIPAFPNVPSIQFSPIYITKLPQVKYGHLKFLNLEKIRVPKNFKPCTIQKYGPLKTSNSIGCIFITKNVQIKKIV